MACNYYFEGHLIGNELLLADFLLLKHKYLDKFGDLVFLLTDRALSTNQKLLGEISKKAQDADMRLKRYVAKHGVDYGPDGQVINLESPAMGVNKFLGKYVHTEGPMKGHRIIPEFIKEEYWSRKIDRDWPSKQFLDEDENELICEIEGDKDFIEKVKTGQIELTKETMENWKNKIQEKWDAQGKIGTSLHAVSELFFGKTGDSYNYEALEADPNTLVTWYNDLFKNKTDEYGKITFGDFVSFDLFKQMVEMCSKLKQLLEDQYGEGLTFYPEFTVASDLSQPFKYKNEKTGKEEECKEIMGIIDLLVIDKHGRTHIFDYKTSPKEWSHYSTAKKRGFTYQLAVYDRILQHYGIYTGDGSTSIIPIKLENFSYDAPTGKYKFDNISYEVTKGGNSSVNVKDLSIKGDIKIESDINEFLPQGVKLELYADNLLEKVQNSMAELFPTYHQLKNMDDNQIRQMIEEAGGFKSNKNGELRYKFNYGFGKEIIIPADEAHLEAEMFKQVKEEIASWPAKKQRMVEGFKDDFNEAVKNQTPFKYKHSQLGSGKLNSNYISEIITPYCDGSYELLDDEAARAALSLGMLMLQNKEDSTITILKLTGSLLNFLHEFLPGRTNMNGAFAPDIEEDSKGNSLMLKAINANIEAMEAMFALLNMEGNYAFNIKEIKVINPRTLTGQPVSNRELLYTYKNLIEKKNVLGSDPNKFAGKDPKIRLLSDAERLKAEFMRILSKDPEKLQSGKFWDMATSETFSENIRPEIQRLNSLDWNNDITKDKLYNELDDLRKKLELIYDETREVHRDLNALMKPEIQLYNAIMSTMMELKGIDIRQQIKDADNWLENKKIWQYGWEGLMLENAGNFKSPILNLLTKSVSNVYLKVKDRVNRENVTLRKLTEALKRQKNFGWVRSNVSGNQTDMYKNMTYVGADGDFLFANPNTLLGAEKEFLEYALDTINKNRYPNLSDEILESWKNSNDPRYYRVPLMAASTGSRMSTTNMVETLKDRLKKWSPKGALLELEEKAMGFFNDESETWDRKEKVYEMSNIFQSGELETRERMLAGPEGANAFEHNIETLLLAHSYAYELEKLMSREMPVIKASALALSMQGAGANTEKGNVNNLLDFIEKYTKGVVKNLSIVNKDLRSLQALTGKARLAASFLALAFSPILFTYQSLEGLWKNCALIIKKPDGTNAFTADNMWHSAKEAYKDLCHYSDKPTKCLMINEIYGLNDMDANQFTLRINSDHGIWTHFTDFAFRLASRPDFYNRMTVFGAQMRNDGTWDAHELIDGALVYKFDKDKRYSALKTHPKGSPEYNEALSRYIAALEQFKNEGVTNPDGSELKFGDDLPRAYTNMEAQGMKAIADGMYGYYNHENKSMLNSMFLGGLATQMKTYWSAKKNQYLAPGGVKLMGKWQDYKENGEQLYYQTDERGEIDLSKPFVKEGEAGNSGIKVQKWEGLWQEGAILTLSKLCQGYKENSSWGKAWNEVWNNSDVNLRTAYRSNLKHLLMDIFLAAIVANLFAALMNPWRDEVEKEFNRDLEDMGKAAHLAAVNLIADSFEHSFMDFNFLDSIFSPTMNWQPFAFSSLSKLAKNTAEYITTDKSFASTIANSSAALRLAKPIIKCIGYNED